MKPPALSRPREAELRAAAETLGLREVVFVDYHDGELDQADPAEAIVSAGLCPTCGACDPRW